MRKNEGKGRFVQAALAVPESSSEKVRKTTFFEPYLLKTIIFPRQARDKHRESTQKRRRSLQEAKTVAVHGPITQGELLMGLGIEARLSQLVGAAGINISSQNATHTRARSFLRKADAKLYQAKLRMTRCQDKLRTARCQDKLRPMHSFRRGGDGAWSLCYRRRDPAGRLKDALLYGPVRKTPLFAPFIYKTVILPRQARDKHRENSQKSGVFRRLFKALGAFPFVVEF